MPSTRALRSTSSCTTRLPTPPAAAETATVSPGRGATARTAAYAVAPTTYSEPAASQLNWGGLWISWLTGTAVWVAWLDRRKLNPSTSSPTANSVTPGPTAVTTPARSLPSPDGNVAGNISCIAPTADAGLAGVDPGGTNLDHHLARAGRRHVDVCHIQHITPPVAVEPHRACCHRPTFLPRACAFVQRHAVAAVELCTLAGPWSALDETEQLQVGDVFVDQRCRQMRNVFVCTDFRRLHRLAEHIGRSGCAPQRLLRLLVGVSSGSTEC